MLDLEVELTMKYPFTTNPLSRLWLLNCYHLQLLICRSWGFIQITAKIKRVEMGNRSNAVLQTPTLTLNLKSCDPQNSLLFLLFESPVNLINMNLSGQVTIVKYF